MLGLTLTLLIYVHWGKPPTQPHFFSPFIFGVWLISPHPPTQSPHNPTHLVGYPWLEVLYTNHGIP
jgi:hypothetical protein